MWMDHAHTVLSERRWRVYDSIYVKFWDWQVHRARVDQWLSRLGGGRGGSPGGEGNTAQGLFVG